MKQQFLVDIADTFKIYVYENNRKLVPSSATITVYKPASSTKLIDAAAMTVAADGQLSYSLTATHNDIADENYKAVIAYVVSVTTHYTTLYYDVVNSKLVKVITDEDIVNELPQLREKGWRFHGTMDTGSNATAIVDAELKRFEDDYFTGGLATNLENDETREITDFVSSTGTVTAASFATANAAGNKYILQRSFSKEIQRAFEKLEDMLQRAGKRAHLILDPYDVREVHLHLAAAEACKALITDDGNLWWQLKEDYDKRAYAIFKSIELKYDTSADGYISGSEEKKRMRMTLGRG